MTMPFAVSDPAWLWLLIPALAVVGIGWFTASRTLPRARRIASLIIRVVLVTALVLALCRRATRASVGPAERRVPARRIGLDARRHP